MNGFEYGDDKEEVEEDDFAEQGFDYDHYDDLVENATELYSDSEEEDQAIEDVPSATTFDMYDEEIVDYIDEENLGRLQELMESGHNGYDVGVDDANLEDQNEAEENYSIHSNVSIDSEVFDAFDKDEIETNTGM